eukprot:Trichotokara_eunicae@DN3080_c0_g1_i1.p1
MRLWGRRLSWAALVVVTPPWLSGWDCCMNDDVTEFTRMNDRSDEATLPFLGCAFYEEENERTDVLVEQIYDDTDTSSEVPKVEKETEFDDLKTESITVLAGPKNIAKWKIGKEKANKYFSKIYFKDDINKKKKKKKKKKKYSALI